MIALEVCVGSSCHLKGSYDVILELKRLITENSLESRIELKGCFCLGNCKDGVSVRFNGKTYASVTKDNVGGFFIDHILTSVQEEGGMGDESDIDNQGQLP
jgi:NADH:ubiquinone oxidoreductase subunit E